MTKISVEFVETSEQHNPGQVRQTEQNANGLTRTQHSSPVTQAGSDARVALSRQQTSVELQRVVGRAPPSRQAVHEGIANTRIATIGASVENKFRKKLKRKRSTMGVNANIFVCKKATRQVH
jgi:hypothetical protein